MCIVNIVGILGGLLFLLVVSQLIKIESKRG